jgi:UDP-N-acetylmuramoyl-tripeptide--D-alanyl-D-alanine ligase
MKNKELESIYKIFLQKIVPIKKGFRKRAVKIDSREVKKGDIFFALRGDNFNGNLFVQEVLKKDPTLVVLDSSEVFDKITKKIEKDFTGKSPSSIKKLRTSLEKIVLVKNSLKTFQDLAKKYRQDLKIPFLGITGSNGKTTTKELVYEVLSQKYNVLSTVGNLNNHIGVPLTILSIRKKHNFAVIEMGANHTGEIKTLAQIAKPDFGIITNIGKAHIGEFKNFANIKKTKKELYNEVLKNNGKIFINQEDVVLEKISQDFLQNQKVKYSEGGILESEKFLTIKIEKIKEIKTKLVGEYNLNNFLAAHTVGKYFKVSDIKIKEALQSYKPKNNRSEAEKTKKKNNII